MEGRQVSSQKLAVCVLALVLMVASAAEKTMAQLPSTEQILSAGEERSEILCAKAAEMVSRRRLDDAVNVLTEALLAFPNSNTARWHLGKVYVKKGNIDQAYRFWKQIAPSNKNFDQDWIFWVAFLKRDKIEVKQRVSMISSEAKTIVFKAEGSGIRDLLGRKFWKNFQIGELKGRFFEERFPIDRLILLYDLRKARKLTAEQYILKCDAVLGSNWIGFHGWLEPLASALFAESMIELLESNPYKADVLAKRLSSPAMNRELLIHSKDRVEIGSWK